MCCLASCIGIAVISAMAPLGEVRPPVLTVASADLADDAVVVTATRIAPRGVDVPVYSPPVSLSEITEGLVSGSVAGDGRAQDEKAVEAQRRMQSEMIRSLPR